MKCYMKVRLLKQNQKNKFEHIQIHYHQSKYRIYSPSRFALRGEKAFYSNYSFLTINNKNLEEVQLSIFDMLTSNNVKQECYKGQIIS